MTQPRALTDVVLFFAGDGIATDLSVLDGREVPVGREQVLQTLSCVGGPRRHSWAAPRGSFWTLSLRQGTVKWQQLPRLSWVR